MTSVALACKLAEWFWRVMVKRVNHVQQGLAQYEAQVLETKRVALRLLAKQPGQVVLPSLAELQRPKTFNSPQPLNTANLPSDQIGSWKGQTPAWEDFATCDRLAR